MIQKQLATLERKTATLQREVQEKTEEIEATKHRLEQYKDYDTVKNELEVLKVQNTGPSDWRTYKSKKRPGDY